MAWRKNLEGKGAALAALLLPLLLACCTTSPETAFDWNVNDRVARTATPQPKIAAASSGYSQNPNAVAMPRQKPVQNGNSVVASNTNNEVRAAQPVAGSGTFVWPVSGKVISNFGSTLQGERNDGINIATPLGTPIRAAASGSVSYAGNELKGYGNLILIRHDNGYVTAYAHADRLVVGRGDSVLKGQVIGYAGQTGDVTSPQVHFEIRRGVTPVNPQPLLVASR